MKAKGSYTAYTEGVEQSKGRQVGMGLMIFCFAGIYVLGGPAGTERKRIDARMPTIHARLRAKKVVEPCHFVTFREAHKRSSTQQSTRLGS